MQKSVLPNNVLLEEVGRLVKEGEQVVIMTKGVSMLPFIRGNKDSVLLKSPDDVRKGDIVLARISADRYVLHRLIEVDEDRFTLMGDGNIKGVERCRREDIMAVAITILRGEGSKVDCRSKGHRAKAKIWGLMLPARRFLLAIYRRMF